MGQDDQPTQAFGEPYRSPGAPAGDDSARPVGGEQQTHVFGGSDQATRAYGPGPTGQGVPGQVGADPTRAYSAADEADTGRLPSYHEGTDDQPYREVRHSFYDADYVARQQAQSYGPQSYDSQPYGQQPYSPQPGQQPPAQPPETPPAPRNGRPGRGRARLMLALGVIIGLVVMGFAAAVRDATRTPEPGPTVTATVTATTTTTVTRTPVINVPTQIPTRLPSVSAPIQLPSSFPSFRLPQIPGLNGNNTDNNNG